MAPSALGLGGLSFNFVFLFSVDGLRGGGLVLV